MKSMMLLTAALSLPAFSGDSPARPAATPLAPVSMQLEVRRGGYSHARDAELRLGVKLLHRGSKGFMITGNAGGRAVPALAVKRGEWVEGIWFEQVLIHGTGVELALRPLGFRAYRALGWVDGRPVDAIFGPSGFGTDVIKDLGVALVVRDEGRNLSVKGTIDFSAYDSPRLAMLAACAVILRIDPPR